MTIQETFNAGVQRHEAGDLAAATALFRRVLEAQPNHALAMFMLGAIALQVGQAETAVQLLRRATAINPAASDFHLNLGAALDTLGHTDEAMAAYRKALSLNAESVHALSNLGNCLRRQRRNPEAIEWLRQAVAVKPDFAEGHTNLGLALAAAGDAEGAIAAFTQAALLQPESADVLRHLGNALHDCGRFEQAIAVFRQALSLQPILPETWAGMGNALSEIGEFESAVAACRQALELDPQLAMAHNNLGKALQEQKQYEAAAACFRRAIELAPDHADAHNNLAAVWYALGDWDQALVGCQTAIGLRPDYADAFNNLAGALKRKGRFDEAIWNLNRAVLLQPDFAAAHWNLGITLLSRGEFERGWPEYEWRQRDRHLGPPPPVFSQPRWDGADLRGQHILLYCEQGYGDAIQFVRYVPLVTERGGKVIVSCPAQLSSLLMQMDGVEAASHSSEFLPAFTVQCPLMSLPVVLNTNLSNIPASVPYLRADARKAEQWRERLAGGDLLKIGLVWAGNPKYANDRDRSIGADRFAALKRARAAQYVSLQKGRPREESDLMRLTDWTDELADFSDTAALVANLDLVITVDTAVAHLAGALGKAVWVLLPFVPDWRWLLDRGDSPWYPTMRLFRQPTSGDWSTPLEQVARELKVL